ncbi:MAG: 4-alpha-glucanotransferase [Acidimicrobiales bacterium]|nr:MAG: 4-alpha-glucanotransferase [Acidimicrobiales bacterium]
MPDRRQLEERARAWGIEPSYRDVRDEWIEVPSTTLEALLGAMIPGPESPGPGDVNPVRVVHQDQPIVLDQPWELTLEDGQAAVVEGHLEPLPLGYHDLTRQADGHHQRLIVSPGRCHLPDKLRTWAWAVQLYATRSTRSWGIGDLADLRTLAQWSAARGAQLLVVSPLHAPLPGLPSEPSPYSPSSRCWRNPLHIRVEEVPGLAGAAEVEPLAQAGRALDANRRIDRDKVWRLKAAALEWAWSQTGEEPNFAKWSLRQGPSLATYAAFCALAEVHPGPWPGWPEDLRHPEGAGVAAFVARHSARVGFHQWLQWLLDCQLGAAGESLGLVTDMAIGVIPEGADTWMWQDCFALGTRVGAPPDEFNTRGQNWGVVPFDPWRLRGAAFEPFVRTVRAGLRHAGGLRVDHVMGLFRLWWIPEGAEATDGAYVRYPWSQLLDILALESVRAQAVVVGEDLGTVEDFVRDELGRRDVLSTAVMWFEEGAPETFRRRAVASVTTHDLPTVAGVWTGADLAAQTELGLEPDVAAHEGLRSRLRGWTALGDDTDPGQVALATYRRLAAAPSVVLAATLEDALGISERPNLPGTVDERPNWSLALPVPLEEVLADPVVEAVAEALSTRAAGPDQLPERSLRAHPEGPAAER